MQKWVNKIKDELTILEMNNWLFTNQLLKRETNKERDEIIKSEKLNFMFKWMNE